MVGSDKLALIIASDTYQSLDLGPLPSCKKDAEALSKLLVEKGYKIFHGEPVIASNLPDDESAWNKIDETYRRFFLSARADQTLLFYFSGHGVRWGDDNVILASKYIDPSIGTRGISFRELLPLIKMSPSRQIVVVIDACYSGQLVDVQRNLKKLWNEFQNADFRLLLSSRSYQEAESEIDGNSVFTKFLLEGLKGVRRTNENAWSASVDDYGNITTRSLHEYVYHKVADDTSSNQLPVYFPEQESKSIILLQYPELASKDPKRDAEVEQMAKQSLLETYYNVNADRLIPVRSQMLDKAEYWLKNWDNLDVSKGKKILLITGVPGCGKSWFAFQLISKLWNDGYDILAIKGDKADKYPTGISNKSFPIFILDDRDVGIDGVAGGVHMEQLGEIIQKSTQLRFAGPVVVSMRKDTWNRLTSGTIPTCKKLLDSDEKKIVERCEIDLQTQESVEVADSIIRSFYEQVNGKEPPYRFNVDDEIRKSIIEKSKANLVIIKIFLEQIGRNKPNNYKVTSEDVDNIISDPRYYILFNLFFYYLGSAANIDETAEILAGLYFVARNGFISMGSLYHLWQNYWQLRKRPLPEKVYNYLSSLFMLKRPYERPPPLFDIDRYGSMISFHGSVDKAIVSLLENPEKLLGEVMAAHDDIAEESELGERNSEYLETTIKYIGQNIDYIRTRIQSFDSQYLSDIESWIVSELSIWLAQKQSLEKVDPTTPKDSGEADGELEDEECTNVNQLKILVPDAYYFLSMFKEYVEPSKKFDKDRYQKYSLTFENVYQTAEIETGTGYGEVATTVNRLLYHLFEKATSTGITTSKGQLLYQFGAYEADLNLMLDDYFQNRDIYAEPRANNDYEKFLLLRRVGLSLMTIGDLGPAETLYTKSYGIAIRNRGQAAFDKNRALKIIPEIDAGKALQLKAELYIHQGRLTESIQSADGAISLYRPHIKGIYCSTGDEMWGVQNIAMGPFQLIICSLAYKAWAFYLSGDKMNADINFQRAEKLARYINPENRPKNSKYPNRPKPMRHLRDLWGIYHADFLLRKDDFGTGMAQIITLENLAYAKCNRLTEIISQCYRVLGDIEIKLAERCDKVDRNKAQRRYRQAKKYYTDALNIARKTSHHAVLLEALLGIANWHMKQGGIKNAIDDYLYEAYYKLPNTKNYKIYKTDVEIAIARGYSEDGKKDLAKSFAKAALDTSKSIHYHWGETEAMSILQKLGSSP